jgi:RNA polymerase sigma-70 factor (ECF subfamily)
MKCNKEVDTLLIRLRDHGRENDFKLLYNLLYNKFFRIAIYYLKKEEWSQEVVLDVFLTLWNKRCAGIPNFTRIKS